ncbi:MAG TPA: hypothetical protein VEA41_18835 [Salinarimonas sp.]|nr:hypothetical protein [Salinarimonas sp.]
MATNPLSPIDQTDFEQSVFAAVEAISTIAEHCSEGAAEVDLDAFDQPVEECVRQARVLADEVSLQCASAGIPLEQAGDQDGNTAVNEGEEYKTAVFGAARFGKIASYLHRTHESWNLAVAGRENAQAVGDVLVSNNGWRELNRLRSQVHAAYRQAHARRLGPDSGLPFER